MILTCCTFVIGKERIRNPIAEDETENHSPQNQITQQHKRKEKKMAWILDCFILVPQQESTPHARLMTNPPIDQLEWNWIEPPGHESKCDSGPSEPLPLPAVAWTPPGVHYQLWQQPLFLGEGQRNPRPLMAHSRVTAWKVHFDPCLLPFRDSVPPTTTTTPAAPPYPGVLSLLVWPLKWPLNTVRVSHVWLVWHWTAERICKSNADVCLRTRGLRLSVFNQSLQHLGRGWNKHNNRTHVFVGAFCHSKIKALSAWDRLNIWSAEGKM